MRDTQINSARARLLELEAELLQTLANCRAVLSAVEEENRELRQREREQNLEYFDERDVAKLWKVSESTVKRLRKLHRFDVTMVGTQRRYTAAQVAANAEKLATAETATAHGRKRHRLREVK